MGTEEVAVYPLDSNEYMNQCAFLGVLSKEGGPSVQARGSI